MMMRRPSRSSGICSETPQRARVPADRRQSESARARLQHLLSLYKYDFNKEPEKIMRELIDTRGIKAIKIWPFDGAAARNTEPVRHAAGSSTRRSLPVKKLRDAFGSEIEIAMEFHSQWNVTSAIRIAHALEPYRPMWLEDMLMPGNSAQYRELAVATSLPLIAGERMAGKMQFEQLLESRTVKYVMFDVTWCGGLTEARKIAAMADAFELPICPHTAGGPLLFYASTHLSTASPNVWIQESCQRFYERDWPAMLENPIAPENGFIRAPEEPRLRHAHQTGSLESPIRSAASEHLVKPGLARRQFL